MTDILRITGTTPLDKTYKKSSEKVSKSDTIKDSVVISDTAKAEHLKSAIKEVIKEAPDIRKEKVEEARKKLDSGEYLSEKVAEVVAEKIIESMGL
ncbi:MAG: flagellar biosynthesis anti-sigma factor FlgM [Candidatus Hydrogenedentota bacterium]